ncbi:hypothetical protein ACHAWX_002948 [Stephanocyclus meneghinianus]
MVHSSIVKISRWACLLLLPLALAQENVDGYNNLGRGSCIDNRGQFYSYIQRTLTFPDASTCASAECAKFGNAESYRGFEFSVTKRCTCLFDAEKMPPVKNDASNPDYVSKNYQGVDKVVGTSGTPGATCYRIGVSVIRFVCANVAALYSREISAWIVGGNEATDSLLISPFQNLCREIQEL